MATAFAVPANNVTASVGAGGYTSGSGTLALTAGQGVLFPALTGTQFYRITVSQVTYAYVPTETLANCTIFRATALTTDTFSGVTAIEGTTDRNYVSGDVVDVRVTAGTIDDLQTATLALQTAAQSVLGGNVPITAESPTWASTTLTLSIPAAGTYVLSYGVRIQMAGTTSDLFMLCRLDRSDTGGVVTGSEAMILYLGPGLVTVLGSANGIQANVSRTVVVTLNSACTITLKAQRGGGGTFTLSNVLSDADGKTVMAYQRIT